jgi:hypothetical protein
MTLPKTDPRQAKQQRTKLWDVVHAYVRREGGAVVSLPHKRTLRIELPIGSAVPGRFSELGYRVLPRGTSTRIERGQFREVLVFEIDLP